jgi:protoporphyrinogen oxidase
VSKKTAIIVGAGPAGLTAAMELLEKTDIQPIILETSTQIGGISRTVQFEGNRIDIGLHRFFSKSEKVNQWWQKVCPVQQKSIVKNTVFIGENYSFNKVDKLGQKEDSCIMLIRNRLSRIIHQRKFFDYPISLNLNTFFNLGLIEIEKICLSYARANLFPIKKEISLEDFFINRFGRELYGLFFKDYTEKIWGIPCRKIGSEWGVQRIKGLSIAKVISHALKINFLKHFSIADKDIEPSLIRQYKFPRLGAGHFWEKVAQDIKEGGGEILLGYNVIRFDLEGNRVTKTYARIKNTQEIKEFRGDYFFSTMPVKDLIPSLNGAVPEEVKQVASELPYRDHIIVGLLLKRLRLKNKSKVKTINGIIPDSWIYVQEKDIQAGRVQIINNWSPDMVKDVNTVLIGLEYFCNRHDALDVKSDEELTRLAIFESSKMGFIYEEDVLSGIVIRTPGAYPAYFGSFKKFKLIRDFTDCFENLYLIGRNGMHRYNNMDHSMLTAIAAVENIINDIKTKDNIWNINTDNEYQEEIQ